MNRDGSHIDQHELSQRRTGTEEILDRRWPGLFMVLLILLTLVWPLGGIAAALMAYLMADRDQATVLLAVAAGVLLLRRALGG